MRACELALVTFSLLGCSVGISSESSTAGVSIPCSTSKECPANMVCTENVCRASQLAIPHVLIDVSVPASTNAGQYSGANFVLPADVPALGEADIVLPEFDSLTVDGNFAPVSNGTSCDYSADDAGIASVRVEATHRWLVDGLERTVFSAGALPAVFAGVPAGIGYDYEAYVSVTTVDPNCQLPPVLVRDIGVSADRALTLEWPVPKSVALDVQILPSNSATTTDLTGWLLDVVDPVEGRSLANPALLGSPIADAANPALLHFHSTIKYNPILSADSSPPVATEVIRLQPPKGMVAPTYYVAMSGLTLFATTTETPLNINAVPAPVTISGRVETADLAQPLQAPITFLSTGFNVSNSGYLAEYSTSTQSDASGQFQVTLPAGQYRVLVVPAGDGKHGVLDTNWSVQATPANQAGRLLQVPGYSEIRGRIDGSLQLSASDSATVQATPSSSLLYDKASQIVAIRNTSPGVRTASALFQPQSNPEFSLPVDSGQLDIALQPPPGLPWIVSPGHKIVAGENTLPNWSMPIAVPWSGSLRVTAKDPSASPNAQALPRAVLRLYALVDDQGKAVDSPNAATSLVEIAEGRTLADGSFQLKLPDRFQP